MKKVFSFILVIILIIGVLPFGSITAFADTFEDFTYIVENGEVTITDYNESATGEVVIPEKIDGFTVKEINEYAFENCANITDIKISNTVTRIGYEAFYNCTGLTDITIPSSVTNIWDGAFAFCSNLKTVTIDSEDFLLNYSDNDYWEDWSGDPYGDFLLYYATTLYIKSTIADSFVCNSYSFTQVAESDREGYVKYVK